MIYTLTLNPCLDRELTVPAIEFDSVLRATKTQLDFGGKGFNVSRLLIGLGAPNTAIGFVGGKAGEMLDAGLQALGIDTDFVWIGGETRTNVSLVTPSGGQYLKVNEPGPAIEPANQQELLDKIERQARPGDWWVLAGSLPPGVPDSFYAQIVAGLNAHGALTVLDTAGPALRLGCQAKPFLIKPNIEEARALAGRPKAAPAEIAADLRGLGAQNVVISMGKAGALLHASGETWLAHSPVVAEKNPIGAGDSMVGGLVWALTQGKSLKDSLGWGVASGAATASLSGTEVGTRSLIEALLAHVRFERLEPL